VTGACPPFGFRLRSGPSGVGLDVYGDPPATSLVSRFEGHGCLAAVLGRLHYRHDALARLRVTPSLEASCRTNDAALAVGIYLTAGAEGLAGLEGEFALALWDARTRRLVGRRDPLGSYPLFWATTPETTAFSTGLGPLLDLLGTRTFDLDYLARFLLTGSPAEPADESCAYQGVQRVLADTIVSHEPGGVKRRRYWDWLDRVQDPDTDDLEDIAQAYREILTGAVRQRMGGVTACQLSGGMDSTAVCLLALDLVRSGVAPAPLHALSLVYEALPQLAKERPYIEAVLEAEAPHLAAHRIEADHLLDFDCLIDPPYHDEPFLGLSALTSERALVESAAASRASAMLTGRGGDDLLVVEPGHIGDLVRAGHPVTAWREACRFALARGSNAGRIFRRQGLEAIAPARRRAIRLRSQPGLRQLDDHTVPPWVSPAFARRHDLGRRARENDHRARRSHLPSCLSLALLQLDHRVGDPYRWSLAAPLGLSMSHPFLDPRLVRFALGALTRLAPSPQPVKPLLTAAMRGVLPEAIRTRSGKRSFNEVYYLGLRRNLDVLEALAHDAPTDMLGIDGDVLVTYLRDAALGVADPRQSFGIDTTLALLRWTSAQAAAIAEEPGQHRPLQPSGHAS
jgi:asparagine synthase (glutamine-hydrolysing)